MHCIVMIYTHLWAKPNYSNVESKCTTHSQVDRVFCCELTDNKPLYCQHMVPMGEKQLNGS